MKKLTTTFTVLFLLVFLSEMALAESELAGKYMTLVTGKNKIVTRTAHEVVIGDKYLNSENHLYEVYKVKGEKAYCKWVHEKSKVLSEVYLSVSDWWDSLLFKAQVKEKGPICIYHTHSDESYIPTDGTSSKKGNGGVFEVGDSLTKEFEKLGVPAVHSKTPHDPHDAMAYDRSRRTAAQLMKQRPSVLLDIHRDAVPREEYATEINGEGVTKVQLVVGRENPNFEATNKFAKQIKKIVDKKYPGFIKGIFYGKGKYNEDLTPRLMLLEFGTNTNSRQSAERAAKIFAASAKEALYGQAGMGIAAQGSWRSLFWIVAALVGGVGLFILINRGSLKDIGKEFTGALGDEIPKELTKDYQENESEKDEES